jgi:DNA-binding PadR family transcriptional regulator
MSAKSRGIYGQEGKDESSTSSPPRLSGKESIVLNLLLQEELYGLELVRRSKGALKRGTVYTTLRRMEEKGYVASRQEDKLTHVPGIPRRLFSVTPYGTRLVEAQQLVVNFMFQEVPA